MDDPNVEFFRDLLKRIEELKYGQMNITVVVHQSVVTDLITSEQRHIRYCHKKSIDNDAGNMRELAQK